MSFRGGPTELHSIEQDYLKNLPGNNPYPGAFGASCLPAGARWLLVSCDFVGTLVKMLVEALEP